MQERFDTLEDYVAALGGKRVIHKILLANNGISAVKCIRSMRQWAYTYLNTASLHFVAMATPEDLKANAEYIRMADQFVEVPGGSNVNNYANVSLICQLAQRFEVDAVWAGWGHASEKPALPTTLKKLGMVFIGPGADSMYALGDKIGSTIIAQSADVPTIKWNGSHLRTNYKKLKNIPAKLYAEANVTTKQDCVKAVLEVGTPVMIKASEGGGGKGIRMLDSSKVEDIETAFRQVQSEVPGSPIFVMKLASKSRHLEVQLIADEYGNAIALSGRDCSVQRRHQKILEEGPPIVVEDDKVWRAMEAAAVRLAKEVGYINAGTVEYLYAPETQEFFFLELNPRLQVEHPVTEMITGVNLPASQLNVAMGIPLHRIPDIRKFYNEEVLGDTEIDFTTRLPRKADGHVIAARITAENPFEGFTPTSGRIQELNFRSSRNVWGYFSVDSSGNVHEFADSQIGHVFSWGPTRDEARKGLVLALQDISIRGDIRTTVEYLQDLIENKTYIDNKFDTAWLDGRIKQNKEKAPASKIDPILAVVIGSACQAFSSFAKNEKEYIELLERGQMPGKELLVRSKNIELILDGIKYPMRVDLSGPETMTVSMNGGKVELGARTLADGGYLLIIGGKSHVAYLKQEVGSVRLVVDNITCLFADEYDPTKLQAKMGGKLLRYLVPDGAKLAKNQAFAEIEVMKMNMQLVAKENGTISFVKPEGSVMEPGDLICRMKVEDESTISKATLFSKPLPDLGHPIPSFLASMPQTIQESVLQSLKNQLNGYSVDRATAVSSLDSLLAAFSDPNLPIVKVEDALSKVKHSLPLDVSEKIIEIGQEFKSTSPTHKFSETAGASYCKQVLHYLQDKKFVTELAEIYGILQIFQEGLGRAHVEVLSDLLSQFLDVETIFAKFELSDSAQKDDTMQELRRFYSSQLDKVLSLSLAHAAVSERSWLCMEVTKKMEKLLNKLSSQESIKIGTDTLTKLGSLQSSCCTNISLEARKTLLTLQQLTYSERRNALCQVLAKISSNSRDRSHMEKLVSQSEAVLHLLLDIIADPTKQHLKQVSMEIYIRRIYAGYSIDDFESDSKGELGVFQFHSEAEAEVRPMGIPSSKSYENLSSFNFTENESLDEESQPSGGRVARAASVFQNQNFVGPEVVRQGIIVHFTGMKQLEAELKRVVTKLPVIDVPVNVLHIILTGDSQVTNDPDVLENLFVQNAVMLQDYSIRRITVAILPPSTGEDKPNLMSGFGSGFYTYRQSAAFMEDKIVRNIEAPLAFQLDLDRLANFNVSRISLGRTLKEKLENNVHVYLATAKNDEKVKRYFVRAIIRNLGKVKNVDNIHVLDAYPGPEKVFLQALSSLESLQQNKSTQNHMYFNLLGEVDLEPTYVEQVIKSLTRRYAIRLRGVGVGQLELKFTSSSGFPMRIFMENPTGFNLEITRYVEAVDSENQKSKCYFGVDSFLHEGKNEDEEDVEPDYGRLHGLPLNTPYPVSSVLDQKRARALALGTAYVYDYPTLFIKALRAQWKVEGEKLPDAKEILEAKELVLEEDMTSEDALGCGLHHTKRQVAQNTIGMVAWVITLKTPEFPLGRKIVLIANDITFKAGSFGTKEDELFLRASKYARRHKLPRIYIAANSGARIGMAEEVKQVYKVKFTDPLNPEKGFDYIYVNEEDFKALGPEGRRSIVAEEVELQGEKVFKITDIIGEARDLGVENLRGSGTIAGETSRAYDETFTLTYVSGRCVGIGAYLVRLGQRTIQKGINAPIILTGFSALNALMGREVYSSNLQLGGTQVMYNNGVSHICVRNDFEGVQSILKWLSYVPKTMTLADLPITVPRDPVARDVTYDPTNAATMLPTDFDPRKLLTGSDALGLTGFCDTGSFTECLSGWAKSVVVGRGRLGGIPHGVIITETRTMSKTLPADPAAPTTTENIISQPGQVWFPDSAYKTAQAVSDFNKEKLPLFIFANWRGFSGGQRDMFDEVLKFGAFIVDELVKYTQPVFVYLAPGGELRGGAWVVVDETINAEYMEMYAETTSRGNVLEPAGSASIKYRKADILASMHRVDAVLQKLTMEKSSDAVKQKIQEREEALFPIFKQISLHFADLHDTPGRMKAKGVIREIIPWKDSRRVFYNRLRRRLTEVLFQEQANDKSLTLTEVIETSNLDIDSTDDSEVVQWSLSDAGKAALKASVIKTKARQLLQTLQDADFLSESVNYRGLAEELQKMSH